MKNSNYILEVKNVTKRFALRKQAFGRAKGFVHALNGINLELDKGDILGIVGESGCGKTTLAKLIVALDAPSSGEIIFNNETVFGAKRIKPSIRRQLQLIFQDPAGSLDPTQKTSAMLLEPLLVHKLIAKGQNRQDLVSSLLNQVGLPASFASRYPNQLSGGEKQRVAIARAISLKPKLLILDEPVASLDVYIGMQILELLKKLKQEHSLSYILISHDLRVIGSIANKVAVMYLGRIVEFGKAWRIFKNPLHPYTELLLESSGLRTSGIEDKGEVPSSISIPAGCAFKARCPIAKSRCAEEVPRLEEKQNLGLVACHFRP
jgi:oligopeptide/dipeptide ABC transporter ATP-binding protein